MTQHVLHHPLARRVVVTTAVAALLTAHGAVSGVTGAEAATTTRFGCTGAPATYVVPDGVESLEIVAAGASGGTLEDRAGRGGSVTTRLRVTSGATVTVTVGCADGYNGGAPGWAYKNGGGATDIRTGAATLADRIVVAGGGGGPGSSYLAVGGAGGFPAGSAGADHYDSSGAVITGGKGGTATAGGRPGGIAVAGDCRYASAAQEGRRGAGGEGASAVASGVPAASDGGGGGGGLYGGGGGGATCRSGAGGGGGSSYGPAAAVFSVGVNFGDGYADITPIDAGAVSRQDDTAVSDDCAGGGPLIDAFTGQPGFVRAGFVQPDAQTLWVCTRVETTAGSFGGKLVVSQPTGINGVPTVDSADASCSTEPGNLVPTSHPIVSGAVGDPGDPATYLPYLLDAYSNGSSAWLCVRAGSAGRRVVVPAGAGVTPAVVTFVADPPTAPATAAPAPPAMPSGECQRPLPAGARYLDATVADTRVYLYTESPSATASRVCVRADGAVGAGGALTVDYGGGNGLVPTVETSTTDMSPCTVQVFRNDNPAVHIRRSATGAVPASVCVTVGGDSLRVTAGTGSGQTPASVTWQPDPGTPGA